MALVVAGKTKAPIAEEPEEPKTPKQKRKIKSSRIVKAPTKENNWTPASKKGNYYKELPMQQLYDSEILKLLLEHSKGSITEKIDLKIFYDAYEDDNTREILMADLEHKGLIKMKGIFYVMLTAKGLEMAQDFHGGETNE